MPAPSSPDPGPGLGPALRELRQRAGLSQEALAERSGFDPSWIARIESGDADPKWGDMRQVAEALDTTVIELAALAEELEG